MKETENLNQLKALVSLMDEPIDEIFTEIQSKIISFGTEAIPVLQDAWLNTFVTDQSQRLESTIEEIRFNNLTSLILNWLETHDTPSTNLLHIAAEYVNENYDHLLHQKWLDSIHRDCWLEINDDLTPLEKINVLNHIIYQVHEINSFLPNQNQLLGFFPDYIRNTKKGNALAIGFIYLTLAQKLKIPLYGINLPNQFILAFLDKPLINAPEKPLEVVQNNILFYINPSNSGAVFTKREITNYLSHQGIKAAESHYLPCTRKTMARIFFSELHQCLLEENRNTKGTRVLDLIQLINSIH
ncbi:MAG: transglutaminase-like domain-containing protein [Bacteroidetes bacterium]|nr:transglutaminase-like domain-containing protein [Bacteroidota bacterium]